MVWVKAIVQSELEEGQMLVVELEGNNILLARHDGAFYATASRCPHMGGHLLRGKLQDGAVVCPLHHSAFDLRTGDVMDWAPWPPLVGRMLGAISREKALRTYPTRVDDDGQVWVALDGASAS